MRRSYHDPSSEVLDSSGTRSSTNIREGRIQHRSSSSISKRVGSGNTRSQIASRPTSSGRSVDDNGQKEKLDSHMLRLALEDIDQRAAAGLDMDAKVEADELIRRHEHPEIPYRVRTPSANLSKHTLPQPSPPAQQYSAVPEADALPVIKKRGSLSRMSSACANVLPSHRRRSSARKRSVSGKHTGVFANPEDKIYEDPVDRLIHVPEPVQEPVKQPAISMVADSELKTAPSYTRKNPFARAHAARQSRSEAPYRLSTKPFADQSASQIQRASPEPDPSVDRPSSEPRPNCQDDTVDEGPRFKNGIEVRGDDLRAATSFSLRNRSPKLPAPTAVSDSSRRPIVSFKPDWTPPKLEERERASRSTSPQRPSPMPSRMWRDNSESTKSASAPAVPTLHRPGIQVNNGRIVDMPNMVERRRNSRSPPSRPEIPDINVSPVPSISLPDEVVSIPTISISKEPSTIESPAIPTINLSSEPATAHDSRKRPLPQARSRPPAIHASTAPVVPRSGYNPFPATNGRRATALCAQCGLPISGKIVSAAGIRFHPQCFACHTCNTQLECVAFYPEPEKKRDERLDRIQRRLDGEEMPGEQEDGDDSLRFYCHLDFHEHFSPRCKSCKTPIEGEVVVACGAEWHVGHFFCAGCGDVSFCYPHSDWFCN